MRALPEDLPPVHQYSLAQIALYRQALEAVVTNNLPCAVFSNLEESRFYMNIFNLASENREYVQGLLLDLKNFVDQMSQIQRKFGVSSPDFARTLVSRLLNMDDTGGLLRKIISGTPEERCRALYERRTDPVLNLEELARHNLPELQKFVRGTLQDLQHEDLKRTILRSRLGGIIGAQRETPRQAIAQQQPRFFVPRGGEPRRVSLEQLLELMRALQGNEHGRVQQQAIRNQQQQAAAELPGATVVLNGANIKDTNVLQDFRCPILGSFIQDPVKLGTRYYERGAIERWVMQNRTDPMTREPVTVFDIKSAPEYMDKLISTIKEMPQFKLLSSDEQGHLIEQFRCALGGNAPTSPRP